MIEFMYYQKRKDGKIGFINPLLDLEAEGIDEELFYLLNEYSFNAIQNLINKKESA